MRSKPFLHIKAAWFGTGPTFHYCKVRAQSQHACSASKASFMQCKHSGLLRLLRSGCVPAGAPEHAPAPALPGAQPAGQVQRLSHWTSAGAAPSAACMALAQSPLFPPDSLQIPTYVFRGSFHTCSWATHNAELRCEANTKLHGVYTPQGPVSTRGRMCMNEGKRQLRPLHAHMTWILSCWPRSRHTPAVQVHERCWIYTRPGALLRLRLWRERCSSIVFSSSTSYSSFSCLTFSRRL